MIKHSLAISALAAALGLGTAAADGVRHVPPAEADAGAPIELVAEVTDPGARTIVLHYRPTGGAWTEVAFTQRADRNWVAAIPPAAVVSPGVEYYLSSTASAGAAQPIDEFGSEQAPHPIGVRKSAREERRDRDLARTGGKRSRAHSSFEYVDFGQRKKPGATGGEIVVADRYYRIDLDFSYKLLTYPLEEIRFGYTRLEGTVPNSNRKIPETCDTPSQQDTDDCRVAAGFKVGGWFELGLSLAEGFRFDGRGMFMANQESFALGARGELRAGIADGNHIALGFEYMDQVGTSGFFRLGWATVPKVPMTATVEVTDLPNDVRATGVRLLYDVYYPMPSGLRLGARVGYAARDQIIGGPSAGASASFDF